MIYAVVAIQLFLWLFDGFPAFLSIMSMGSHVVYLQNLRRFPIVKLSDPVFIVSCGKATSTQSPNPALVGGCARHWKSKCGSDGQILRLSARPVVRL